MGVTLAALPTSSVCPKTGRPNVRPEAGKAGTGTVVSSRGRFPSMESPARKWFTNFNGSSQGIPCRSLAVNRCNADPFSRRILGKPSAALNVAQELRNVSFKSLEKQNRRVLRRVVQRSGNFDSVAGFRDQRAGASRKKAVNLIAPRQNAEGDMVAAITASRPDAADDCDGPGLSKDKTGAGKIPPQPKPRWLPFATGMATFACAGAAAAKHVLSGSAHATVEKGGGGGRPPPPPGPGGGRGGGGGGGGGDFDAGGGTAEAVFDRRRGEGEEELPPVSLSLRTGLPEPSARRKERRSSPRRVNSLASLSAAAADLIDGGALVREGLASEERGQRAGISESNVGPSSSGKANFDGPKDGPPPDTDEDEQNTPADTFFGEADSDNSSDRPPVASSSGGAENRGDEDRRKGTSARVARSGGAADPSDHSVGGRTPNFPKGHAKGGEHLNGSGDSDNFFSPRSRGGISHDVSPEFSSIRGKITEIPGFGQEGEGKMRNRRRESPAGSGFSGFFGGLLHAIMGHGSDEKETQEADDEKKALISEVAARTLQLISNQASETGLATTSETGALRRLQRETFSDLMRIRERLDKMEHVSGLRHGKYSGNGQQSAKTLLKGHVSSGGAFLLLDDATSSLSRFAFQHAGLLTGLDVRFTFETQMRENDLLVTQCGVGQVSGESDGSVLGGPISLQKINYVAQLTDSLSLAVSPLGAKAHDMAETVNHLQGQALTAFAGGGPALYQRCKGSAVGINLRGRNMLLSMSQFLSGWGSRAADAISGPLCLSTLAQFVVQPCEHMVFSLSAANTSWPSPPLPSSNGYHWSEMGPLVLCKTVTRPTQQAFSFNDLLPTSSNASFLSQIHLLDRDSWNPDAESRAPLGTTGSSMQSVAVSGEVDVGGSASLGGWAQLERESWLEELRRKDFQWNLSLAKSTGPIIDWGLSVGSKKREDWAEDGLTSPTDGDVDIASSQLQIEAFVKWKVGRGFTLQPGLVYILDKDTQTPAVMLRSSWNL